MSVQFAFLDSGAGGLPYLLYLRKMCPSASCVYVADTQHFPYGTKSPYEIILDSSAATDKIIRQWNPKAVILACNTISVTALEDLRRRFPKTPFVGTVPAIKPAAELTKTKKIGLLATNATVNHSYTKNLIADFASDCTVVSRADSELIEFIEHSFTSATEEERLCAVRPAVTFFKEHGCDVIVLACTHFLNISQYFEKEAGPSIKVIDSRDGVVRHALELVPQNFKDFTQTTETKLFITSKDAEKSYRAFCLSSNIEFGGVV